IGGALGGASGAASETGAKASAGKSDGEQKSASRGSSAGEDAVKLLTFAVEDYIQYLINVANENAGSGCSAHAVSKTYANVVYMVQKMYHHTYLPLAILFL